MKVKKWTFEEFPASTLAPEGMKLIKADRSLRFSKPTLNVKYAEKDDMDLHLEIIYPPMTREDSENMEIKFPLVIFIQGSGWMKQDLGASMHGLCEFAARGYVVAIVEYRYADVAIFPAQVKDTKTAIRFMQEHADEYHADREKIFVWGDSSGGHTCVMTAATMEGEFNDEEGPLDVKAFVDYYGPTDLSKMNDQPTMVDHMSRESGEGQLIGRRRMDENPEWADKVNTMNYIKKERDMRPLLIIHGDKDRIVPFEQSVLLYEKMKETGKTVEFYKLEGADHGRDAFFKEPVLDVVDAFLKKWSE